MNDSLPATGADPRPGGGPDDLVGVVLAAGEGRRLRPLTLARPKALCPVGGLALVDLALDRVAPVVGGLAVNVHHGRAAMIEHLGARAGVHVSVEEPVALGTAGALGQLRPWLAGRHVLVVNADAWCPGRLDRFVAGWDRGRVRVLVAGGDGTFGPRAQVAAALLPWAEVAGLESVPSGLYERSWARAHEEGRLEAVAEASPFVDCGTPGRYLAANMAAAAAAGGALIGPGAEVTGSVEASVVGAGAVVAGQVEASVVGDGARVEAGEVLSRAIRLDGRTVLVR